MWLLNFLPNWVFHLAVLVGILGIVVSFFISVIPLVNQYKLPVQIASVAVLVIAIWFEGGLYNEQIWLDRIAELEKKVAIAEAKAKEENVRIETQVIEKVKVVKENVEVIKREIEIKRELINQNCEVSPTAIEMYNKAVKNE